MERLLWQFEVTEVGTTPVQPLLTLISRLKWKTVCWAIFWANPFSKPSRCIIAGVLGPAPARGVEVWQGSRGSSLWSQIISDRNGFTLLWKHPLKTSAGMAGRCVAASAGSERWGLSWAKARSLMWSRKRGPAGALCCASSGKCRCPLMMLFARLSAWLEWLLSLHSRIQRSFVWRGWAVLWLEDRIISFTLFLLLRTLQLWW